MLFRQRFIVKRLTDFNSAFFASKKKNLLEQMGEDPNKVQQKKGPPKKVIDAKTLEYLQNKLKQAKSAVIIDKEHYRIDVGLLLSRDPIFLQMEETEMNGLKFRNKYAKKYNLMLPVPKELTEFNEKISTPTPAMEDLPTHEVMYPDGTRLTYSGNSKLPNNVDPTLTDRSSIQYAPTYRTYLMVKTKGTDQWGFPTSYMPDKTTFSESKTHFFNTLSNKKWEVMFTNNIPVAFTKRALTEEEKSNPLNKKAVGIKTFYFNGYHQNGLVSVNPEMYDEFAWVPRLELNKFLDKTRYDEIVNSLFIV